MMVLVMIMLMTTVLLILFAPLLIGPLFLVGMLTVIALSMLTHGEIFLAADDKESATAARGFGRSLLK